MLEFLERMISLSEIVEGVTIGITISIILGIRAWIKWRVTRRKQVNHLRHLISHGYDRIIGETGFEHREKVIPADILQYRLFQNIMRDIDDALRYRANSLKFNEVHAIKTILIEIDGIVSALDFDQWQNTPNRTFYETHFFGKFRKLKWLELPQ